MADTARPRIAVFAGPNATILNTEPLVTSNKARARWGLPPRERDGGTPLPDVLRPQRLAAPATVYVEQFSAHPLERDAADLYGAADGYVDADGVFHRERSAPADRPVYEVTLNPADGLYPLPYMAMQADGRPWEGDEADPFGPPDRTRQPFFPDAARLFEEIDRLGTGDDGLGGQLARLADYDFFRAAPPGGYTRGLGAADRTDVGAGDIAPEIGGRDFFPYRPPHLLRQPSRPNLARLTNVVQAAMRDDRYAGGLWLEGSPHVEETAYWLSLLVDTTRPMTACAAQRPHGALGAEGDRNLVDAIGYMISGMWADDAGRDATGVVVVEDQQLLAARAVQKAEARPGGYITTGGHGGVLGSITSLGRPVLSWRPLHRHTWSSDVRLTALPTSVAGVRRGPSGLIERTEVPVKADDGSLRADAIPTVGLFKGGQYTEPDDAVNPDRVATITGWLSSALAGTALAGLVAEGNAPFATVGDSAEAALRVAAFSGVPVVRVARGNADGIVERTYVPFAIAGGNLTATKARLLLMASLMKLGALPPAVDPRAPTPDEQRATREALDAYQALFETH